jgi:hypothetical protein
MEIKKINSEYNSHLNFIKERYSDKYFLELGIGKHIRECNFKLNAYNNSSLFGRDKKYYKHELIKELADLFLLLHIFFESEETNWLRVRLDRFIEKIEEEK